MRASCLLLACALACGSGAESGRPLFDDPRWTDRDAAVAHVQEVLGPAWTLSVDRLERPSVRELVAHGVRLAGPTGLDLDQVTVRGTTAGFEVSARARGGGTAAATVRVHERGFDLELRLAGLRLDAQPWRIAGDLALRGELSGQVVLARAGAATTGSIELTCRTCGTAAGRLVPPGRRASASAFAGAGLGLPAIALGDLTLSVTVGDGAEVRLVATGPADLALSATGTLAGGALALCVGARLTEQAPDVLASIVALVGSGREVYLRAHGPPTDLRFRPAASCP